MEVVCPVCRDVVHIYNGIILLHGVTYHGKFERCSGSLTPYGVVCSTYCSD